MRLKQAFQAFFRALKGEAETKVVEKIVEERVIEQDPSHLRLLGLLQQKAQLIDFFQADLDHYSDAKVGAIARDIHEKCQASLEELVTLRPYFSEEEGETVTVEKGFDASAVKLTGRVWGKPPYTGILRHQGWKVHKMNLPEQEKTSGDATVIFPAEIEVRKG